MKDRFGNVPFALFSNGGRWVAMTREDYEEARKIAAMCRCPPRSPNMCDCCRAVEYVRETASASAHHPNHDD